MMTVSSILGQFDLCASNGEFVDLNNGYYFPVDARMNLFRDDARWAMVVELLGYNPGAGNLFDVMHVYGNCLTVGSPGFSNSDFRPCVDNIEEVTGIGPEGEIYSGRAPIVVRGQTLAAQAEVGKPLQDVFRSLVSQHRNAFLASGGELRARIPVDLPKILTLNEWNQPEDLDEMPPSQSETYQQIAAVLDGGDVSCYNPTSPPNTHWSFWPDAGTV